MPPGLLSGPAQDPFAATLGDDDRVRQLVKDQGVPENVARYMVQAPSVYDGGQTSGAWPYPYQGQAQEEQLQTGPQRSDAINRQMWQQRLNPPGAQNIGDVVPLRPGGVAPSGPPGDTGAALDVLKSYGKTDFWSPNDYGAVLHPLGNWVNKHPANEALLQQMMRSYGLG
jgi:hypothetical protein